MNLSLDDLTQDDVRAFCDMASDLKGDWQGIPVPLGPDHPLRLHSRHPLAARLRELDGPSLTVQVAVGGPPADDDLEEVVVNEWFSRRMNATVVVFARGPEGRRFAAKVPRSPDGCMDRLSLWLMTLGASDAWELDAEARAIEKLAGLVTGRQLRQYLLTGAFLETSPRSGLTYLFRRLRPTVALSPRWHRDDVDSMRCIAALCLHPVGYYDRSWAGCMVPSDDVIAHLLLMRADEADYWGQANQHPPWHPEAGL